MYETLILVFSLFRYQANYQNFKFFIELLDSSCCLSEYDKNLDEETGTTKYNNPISLSFAWIFCICMSKKFWINQKNLDKAKIILDLQKDQAFELKGDRFFLS